MAVTFKDGVILGAISSSCPLPLFPSTPPPHISKTKLTSHFPTRRRFQNHDRRIHRQPSDRQADPCPRHHLVLPIRLRRRYTSRCGHCTVPAGHVSHDERKAAHDADGGRDVSGAVLCEQGPVEVSFPKHVSPIPDESGGGICVTVPQRLL